MKLTKYWKWAAVLLLAFVVRFILANTWVWGDVLVMKEWGQQFWQLGPVNFYFHDNWYYSKPTQPPLTSLVLGGLYWLFDHKHVLAQIHNSTHLVPSIVINYFYDMEEPINKKGYIFLLKLPEILTDLALGVLIYKLVLEITNRVKIAWLASLAYLFNPVAIFLSAVWGQTESVIAFFGVLGFLELARKRVFFAIPLYFISLYFKPTWGIFIPLFIYILILVKPKLVQVVIGLLITLGIYYFSTQPFAGDHLVLFTKDIVLHNMLPGAKGTARASVSAFNLHAMLFRIDLDFDTVKFLFIPASFIGSIGYLLVNVFTFRWLVKSGINLLNTMICLFSVGFGSFLFSTNMLERYSFVAFVPLIIIMFSKPKILIPMIIINVIIFLNLFFAFFRRNSDEIGHPFTDHNFLVIRILSLTLIFLWARSVRFMLQFERGR